MGQSYRIILEKENRHTTCQTWVLKEQTLRQPPEKSVRSATSRDRSMVADGSGWPGLWIALDWGIMVLISLLSQCWCQGWNGLKISNLFPMPHFARLNSEFHIFSLDVKINLILFLLYKLSLKKYFKFRFTFILFLCYQKSIFSWHFCLFLLSIFFFVRKRIKKHLHRCIINL